MYIYIDVHLYLLILCFLATSDHSFIHCIECLCPTSGFQNLYSSFQMLVYGLWTPGFWTPESRLQIMREIARHARRWGHCCLEAR